MSEPEHFTHRAPSVVQPRKDRIEFGAVVCVALLFGAVSASAADAVVAVTCGPLSGSEIFDYNDPASRARISVVEQYHFNEDVRALRRGQSSSVPSDLDFVLRAVPNHYEALAAMGRWQAKNGIPRGSDAHVEAADCYFRRAIQFRSQDPRLHAVYAVYLHQAKRLPEAGREYAMAEELGGADAELYYNYGLLLVDAHDIARARQYAEKAYALGYPLPGLRNKLRRYSGK